MAFVVFAVTSLHQNPQNPQRMPSRRHPTPADLRLYYLQRAPPTIAGISDIQTYFPTLETLFPSVAENIYGSPTLAATELVVDVSANGVATVEHLTEKTQRKTPVWIRMTHLVEPLEVLSGEYVLPRDGALPAMREPWQRALRKLNDPMNEAYTDAVFACMASRLVETRRTPHFCRFYGTFNARAPTYTYMITDDMPEIEGEPWFVEGLQKGRFAVEAVDPYDPTLTAPLTHPWEDVRAKLDALAEQRTMTTVEDTDSEDEEGSSIDGDVETESDLSDTTESTEDVELQEAEIEVSGEATVHRPRIQLHRVTDSGSGSGSHSGSDSDSDYEDLEYRAILRDFPVQMTVLERCDGTMDDLMEAEFDEDTTDDMRETKEERWTAWMFQVIAGLAVAQQAYDFVHNDLHTNNVMWVGTGETHLYYHVQGAPGGDRFYRVPTYGRIFKIIDFGRATFRPTAAATGNHMWIPDAYAPGADAYGQYNCGPYYEQGQPKVQPNRSFDLSRLAVAMLDALWPEDPAAVSPRKVLTKEPGRTQHETVSPLWNLLWLWLTDKHGRNVLRAPDGRDRYPEFDLYCAIARDVQNAVPAQQLTLPLFDATYRCRRKDIPADAPIWKLHAQAAAPTEAVNRKTATPAPTPSRR